MGICSGTSTEWLFVHCSRSNWNLAVLIFAEGGKPENPEKNPRSEDENQQQTQPTYGTGPESNPGHIGGRRVHALPTAPSPEVIMISAYYAYRTAYHFAVAESVLVGRCDKIR